MGQSEGVREGRGEGAPELEGEVEALAAQHVVHHVPQQNWQVPGGGQCHRQL